MLSFLLHIPVRIADTCKAIVFSQRPRMLHSIFKAKIKIKINKSKINRCFLARSSLIRICTRNFHKQALMTRSMQARFWEVVFNIHIFNFCTQLVQLSLSIKNLVNMWLLHIIYIYYINLRLYKPNLKFSVIIFDIFLISKLFIFIHWGISIIKNFILFSLIFYKSL